MKFRTSVMAALLAVAVVISPAYAQQNLIWDTNSTTPGFFAPGAYADGTWDNVQALWTTDPTGVAATVPWNAAAAPPDNAIFDVAGASGSPGNPDPLIGSDAAVTVTGTQVVGSLTLESGWVLLRGGTVNTGLGTVTVKTGAILDIDSTLRLNTNGGTGVKAGDVILAGGTLWQRNPGNAGTFLGTGTNGGTGDGGGLRDIMVDGVGTIGYNDGNSANDFVSIFSGVIKGREGGVDGTPTNGGRGTLVKIGPDQIGIGVSDQDLVAGAPRIHSHTLFSFAKLVVEEGTYRLRTTTQDNTARETGFGAVPLAVLPDAITLNGGGIGTSGSVTLHANRGITIGAEGGFLDHGATAGISVPGPITVDASRTFTIGSPTAASASNPQFELTNTGNATTFAGKLHILRSTLSVPDAAALGAVPGSPVADSITLGGTANALATVAATLRFSGSTTLAANRGITLAGTVDGRINIPSGGNTLTYDGVMTGPGKFIKMGDGALTTAGAHTYTGGTDVYGILRVNNTSGSGTGTGAVNIKTSSGLGTNGTLAGTGSVDGLVTVESAGAIAPGATVGGIGTLTLDGGLTLNTGSILTINLGAPTTGDLINVGGTTTINGGTVNVTDAGGLATGIYPILDYTGALGGSFANLALGTTPAGFTINLVDSGSAINLDVSVPVAGLTGDYNDDGVVDAGDFVMWQKLNESNPGGLSLANDLTAGIDASDYTQWSTNFGESGPGSGGNNSAVPEPATLAMLLVGVAAVAAGRRGR